MANIISFNKLSLLIMFSLAALAAAFTVFFALSQGIVTIKVIFLRSFISFIVFLGIGFLFNIFLQNLQADALAEKGPTGKKTTGGLPKKDKAAPPEDNAKKTDMDEQQFSPVQDGIADDSFNRVVIVDKDDDNH